MTIPRLFETGRDLRPGFIFFPDAGTLHYLRRVLRLKPGDSVLVMDGGPVAWLGVLAGDGDGLGVRIEGAAPDVRVAPDGRRICVFVPVLKGDGTELAVQKAVECGITEVRAYYASRSVPRPSGADNRLERLRRVAVEACRQCDRASVPDVALFRSLQDALNGLDSSYPMRFVLDETGRPDQLAELAAEDCPVALAVGPEGSFTDEERGMLARAGFVPAGLGPRVLKAETAVMAAVITVQVAAGDMR